MDLTREQIKALAAGRPLDYLVAEHVFQWRRFDTYRDQARTMAVVQWIDKDRQYPREAPKFSSEIQAAWLIVAKMSERGFYLWMRSPWTAHPEEHDDGFWAAFPPHEWEVFDAIRGETAPLAMCKAALLGLVEA